MRQRCPFNFIRGVIALLALSSWAAPGTRHIRKNGAASVHATNPSVIGAI